MYRTVLLFLFVFTLFHVQATAGMQQALQAFQEKDYKKALDMLTVEAEAGNAKAQFLLGEMYEMGFGVEQDYEKAIAYYANAAWKNKGAAIFALARMQELGLGLEQNIRQAALGYLEAAKLGHANAQHNLAVMYTHGNGIYLSYSNAYMWFCRAAAQGMKESAQAMTALEEVLSQEEIQAAKQKCKLEKK